MLSASTAITTAHNMNVPVGANGILKIQYAIYRSSSSVVTRDCMATVRIIMHHGTKVTVTVT